MIFGIDPDTKDTGFAHGGLNDAPRGGVWKTPGCDELGGVFDRTLGSLGVSLTEMGRLLRPKAVYIETPLTLIDRQHSAQTFITLTQLSGGLRAACAMAHLRVVLCSVYDVRHFFIGTGYLPRDKAKKAVQAKCDEYGWSYADDNEADAKAVWAWGMSREYRGWKPNQAQLFDQTRAAE